MVEKKEIFSDDDVVRSVRDGNTQNFEILIKRYSKKIVNFIYHMIYDIDDAQGIAQDVFLKIYQSLHRYKTSNNFQAFIFTIAKNLTLNHIKKQGRFFSFSNGDSGNLRESYFQTEETQHKMLQESQEDEFLTKALKNLRENQRLAIILKVYLSFSYKKISEITGWSIPKIETLISRGKNNLKNSLIVVEKNLQEKPKKNV